MEKSVERGSEKLFLAEKHDPEGLARALGLARGDFEIKRWWKYGQPVIDRIDAEFQVGPAQLGPTVSQLMQLNGPLLEVTAECFPYGITNPEYRLQVSLQKSQR
ncbi:MAG: hypothetical protein ABUL62_32865 [Myxococcales bacterium]